MEIKNNEQRKKIYQDLKYKIINNELKSETDLVVSKIATEYDVNRIHINSVMQKLLSEGLVNHKPMKGYIVVGLNTNDLLEIAKIRQSLELAVFENYLQIAEDENLEEAKRLIKRKILFMENNMKKDAIQETKLFFDKIYQCSSYKRIVQMLKQYDEYFNIMINKSFELKKDIDKSITNSKLLYDAIDQKNFTYIEQWIKNRYDNLVNKINNK